MTKLLWTLGLIVVLSIASSGVAASAQTASAPEKKWNYHDLMQAPDKAADRKNPLAADPDAVAAGNKLFAIHCSQCHGDSAEGSHYAPALNVPQVTKAPPGALFWLLTNGVVWHGMPVWSKLPEPQRWQLISYIKTLK